ncbi:MAG: energy transducer TonB [Pseudomonadota bacterium]
MSLGGYLSSVAHAALIGYALFGPTFASEPLPAEDIQQVSVISEAEFMALMAPEPEPVTPEVPAALTPPDEPEPEPTPPEVTVPDPAPEPEPLPEPPSPPPPPDPVPAPPEPDPVPEVTEEVIIPPSPVAPETIVAPVTATRPNPRPAPRVAPEPVAPPEPDAQVAEEVQEAAQPLEDAEVVTEVEEQDATSPEEATTETVTEAEEEAPSGAVATSLRPQARPTRPQPQEETEVAEDPAPAASEEDDVANALAEALAAEDPAPAQPTGPPLTSGERDALRVAVSQCWNVGSLSTEALSTIVVVGVDMNADGTPNNGSISLLSSSGGSAQAAQQAYEAARRAIIRCGARGFDLPREKYDQWRKIEMTFNPEQMRIR